MRQNTCENPTTAVALIYLIQIERTGDLLPLQVVLGDDLVSLTEALQHNFETIFRYFHSVSRIGHSNLYLEPLMRLKHFA